MNDCDSWERSYLWLIYPSYVKEIGLEYWLFYPSLIAGTRYISTMIHNIQSVVNPITKQDMSVKEAVKQGIIDEETGKRSEQLYQDTLLWFNQSRISLCEHLQLHQLILLSTLTKSRLPHLTVTVYLNSKRSPSFSWYWVRGVVLELLSGWLVPD